MIKLEDIKNLKSKMTIEEFQKDLQAKLDEFKQNLKDTPVPEGSSYVDEIKKYEDELMEILKDFEEYIKTVEYDLPKAVNYNGSEYVKSKVSNTIINFLNKIDVDWQHTLGMFQLVDFWKKSMNTDKIPYGVLDSTLRCLGGLKFRGYTEWNDILTINEYFKQVNEEYGKDLAISIFLAKIHSMIMDELQMNSPVEQVNE